MGYDVYLSFTADVPDEETGERLREAFFTPDNFGPTLYVESDATALYDIVFQKRFWTKLEP